MDQIIGQTKLLSKLNKYTLDSFPRVSLLLGLKGSGKHLISKYIADNILKLPLFDITDKATKDQLDFIYNVSTPGIYLFDLSEATDKTQNALLKFTEEPPANAFIILLAEGKYNLLNTIVGRSFPFNLDNYDTTELDQFVPESVTDKDLIKDVLKTPGRIVNINIECFKSAVELANKIIDKLSQTNFANMLKIVNNVNYKDNYDKLDVDLFLDLLYNLLARDYIRTNNIQSLKMMNVLNERRGKLRDTRVNKEYFFTSTLIKLWKAARS